MRHRETTTGSYSSHHLRLIRSRSCEGTFSGWSTLSDTLTGSVTKKEIDDVDVPGFQALLKCGAALPINPVVIQTYTNSHDTIDDYTEDTRLVSCSSGFTEEVRGGIFNASAVDNRMILVPPSVSPSTVSAMVHSARARVNAAALDVLTNIFESKDLPRTFRTTLQGVTDLALAAARRSRHPRDFHSHWLNYRYGWMPLIFTLNDAVTAMNNVREGFIREKMSATFNSSDASNRDGPSDPNSLWRFQENYTQRLRVTGMAYGEVSGLSGSYGFDPLVTAWELVPYSFVVDWFFQVGTFLQSVSPFGVAANLRSGYSIRTSLVRKIMTRVYYNNSPTIVKVGSGTLGILTLTTERYERVPDEGGSMPGWNPRLSTERLVDAAALVLNQKRRVFSALHRL